MDDRLARLDDAVASLTASVAALETRLAALEGTRAPAPTQAAALPYGDAVALPPLAEAQTVTSAITLLGRTCLVLGGAFLLRALTDAGTLPLPVGVALGLAWAVASLAAAFLAGRAGRRLSAEFHGLTAVVIAFPLLVEATASFKVLGPGLAAATLCALVALGLAVAWRQELAITAWGLTLATVAVGLVLTRLTFQPIPFVAPLLLLGLATAWLASARGWHGPRWPAALGVDLLVLHVTLQAARPGGPRAPWDGIPVAAAQGLALALFALYLASFAVRTLVRQRNVTLFEATQTVLVLVVGYGGAARIAAATDSGLALLGVAAVVLGGAAYAMAFKSVDRQLGRGLNFAFFTSLALALILSGTWVAAPVAVVVPLWALLALAAAALGGHFDRVTLRAHAAVYALAAAVAAGLVRAIAHAVSGTAFQAISLLGVIALAAAAACYLIVVVTQRGRDTPWPARLPRLVMALTAVSGLGSLIVTAVVAVADGGSPDPGLLAAARSAVLALAALVLAALGRHRTVRELAWLVYPILVVGGLKLLLVDLRAGRPATLFFAFAAYGVALIVAPRLARSRPDTSSPPPATPSPDTGS